MKLRNINHMRRKFLAMLLMSLLFVSFLPGTIRAQAGGATLFLSPGSGTYEVGKSFTLKIMVNSGGGVGINAAEGALSFDPSLVIVTQLSNASTIFKLWTTDPTYSNSAGTIKFGGGSPSAYKGNAGEIFSATFKANKAGTAKINYTSGIILAADGKGTDVFSGFGNASIDIKETTAAEPEKPPVKEEKPKESKGVLPPVPEIESESHSDTEMWYRNNEPEFSWKILSDLSGVSFSVTDKEDSDPGNGAEGIVETLKLEPQSDGEWYFHLKFQNRYGWGQTAHRKFKVDVTEPKDFILSIENNGDTTEPRPKFKFKTVDEASGIDFYTVNYNKESIMVDPVDIEKLGFYQPMPMAPGEYRIEVGAVDKAGNVASSSKSYSVDPLKAPIITDIPKIIDKREQLIVRGTSFYPNVKVKVYLKKIDQDEAYSTVVNTDDSGNWSYFHELDLSRGNYEVWAKIIDERGAMSLNSGVEVLTVVSPSLIEMYGFWIIIIMLIIIIGLIFFVFYREREFMEERMRIKKETDEVKNKLTKIFAALREEVDELIELADKKSGLSESERRVKEKLQESLDIAEEFIAKEVEDVDKEIRLKKR